ncbi:antitoxin [Mariniluteicoccus flavus]
MSFMDKAKDLAGKNPDAARGGIDKVEDAVDARTGGQHAQHVDRAGDMAEKHLGVNDPAAGQPPVDPPPADQPPA